MLLIRINRARKDISISMDNGYNYTAYCIFDYLKITNDMTDTQIKKIFIDNIKFCGV